MGFDEQTDNKIVSLAEAIANDIEWRAEIFLSRSSKDADLSTALTWLLGRTPDQGPRAGA